MRSQFNGISGKDIPKDVCPEITVSCDAETSQNDIMQFPGNVIK